MVEHSAPARVSWEGIAKKLVGETRDCSRQSESRSSPLQVGDVLSSDHASGSWRKRHRGAVLAPHRGRDHGHHRGKDHEPEHRTEDVEKPLIS